MQTLMDAQRGHIERQAAALAELRTAQADGLQRLEVGPAACAALSVNKGFIMSMPASYLTAARSIECDGGCR